MKKFFLFFVVIALVGCGGKTTAVQSTVDVAKNNIDVIVSYNRDCKTVGDVCKKEIENINNICKETIENEKTKAYKNGARAGMIATAIILLLIYFFVIRKFIK